jgi:hypothetical protein
LLGVPAKREPAVVPERQPALAALLLLRFAMARRMANWEGGCGLDVQVILPEQATPRRALDPERRLMLAVLREAVLAYLLDEARSTRAGMLEVEAWFGSDDTSWPYSFGNLCDALGLDRTAVRRALHLQRLERLAS